MTGYKKFFAKQRILIADDSSAIRIAIARCLTELGATVSLINFAESFEAAQGLIATNRFTMLICEYDLGNRCGLDLLSSIRDLSLSIVVTRNQSGAAAACAAENDVDVFITKPFTADELKKAVSQAIDARENPRPVNGIFTELSEAIETVNYTQSAKRVYDKAGYRTLAGLFDALLSEGKKEEAYIVLRRLVKSHPLHPDRLNTALRLAVETRHFDDINAYYALFLNVDTKSDELIRHTYAALVLAGKNRIRAGDLEPAKEYFNRAALTSGRRPSVLREIILALVDHGYAAEADSFISAFPQHERQTLEFLALDFFVMSKSQPLHAVLQRGQQLLRDVQPDPMIYEIIIQARKRAGHHAEAESLALTAARLWPARGDDYRSILEPTTV